MQLTKPFPLLRLETNDQIVQINDTDVRQSNPEQFLLTLKGLASNKLSFGDAPKIQSKDQLLFLTYIKGNDVLPEKHLYKDTVILTSVLRGHSITT